MRSQSLYHDIFPKGNLQHYIGVIFAWSRQRLMWGIVIALSQLFLGCSNMREDFSSRCMQQMEVKAYQKALENCTQAIIYGSNTASDYVRRGYVRTQLGEYKEAIEDYTQALFLQPDAVNVFNHRCVAYYHVGKYQEAIADCSDALSIKPDFAGAYANRGRVRAALKDKKGALTDYQNAAKLFLKQGQMESYQVVQEDIRKLTLEDPSPKEV